MTLKLKKLELTFRDKYLNGLFCIHWDGDGHWSFWTLHFICCRSSWEYREKKRWLWGYLETWYDGPWKFFGLGPFMMLAWR